MGVTALLFIKFKIKIYFQTCGFGLFLYITLFFLQKKNKIVQLHKYKILPPWKWLKHSIKTAPLHMMPLAGKENIQSKIIIPVTDESDRLTQISHTTSEWVRGEGE